tara:strand:- start:1514 stop:2161 length:648 start_codon:yes stop_codon:yes gene_type:complete
MSKFEFLDKERSIEEIEGFSSNAIEQSKLSNISTKNNIYLTSLLVGASLVTSHQSEAKSFEIRDTNQNHISTTFEYNKTVSNDIVNYINSINFISKQTITKYSLITEILSFKSLNESWDGYGSLPLEIESASNAIKLMDLIGEKTFCRVNNFYPNPNGTISFEWINSEKEIVSVEIGNNTFSYFVELSSLKVQFFNNKKINATESKKLAEFIQAI